MPWEGYIMILSQVNDLSFRFERVMLFNVNSAISWREHINFQWDDDEICFLLDHHAYSD
jgi:hypothetical protein